MARLDLGYGIDDHAGWPSTPGLEAATARATEAEEAHRRDGRERRRAERRGTLMAEAGEHLSRLVDEGVIDECALSGEIVALLKAAKEA